MAGVIRTEGLTKFYGGRAVVRELDLAIPEGCCYGLLGRNGAGKTTTIRMLLGFVAPDRGQATIWGEDCRDLRPETRGRIAYLAENHPLYKWMSVREAVDFTRSFQPRWNGTLVEQILEHFELAPRAKIRSLSNGQRAQVALALAVAPDPELLILDDPTLGLDTVVRRDFLESMIQIISRPGRTILFSSHILGDVERVADRIGVMVNGVLRVDCPTERFKQAVRKVVLGFPGEPPPIPAWEGVVSARQVGRSLELVVVDWDGAHQARAEALSPRTIEVLELNLEDAFVEYTRGPRRALPVFATGEVTDEGPTA